MTRDQHTTEPAPGKPLYAPQSAEPPIAGMPGGSDPQNDPQAGAQSLTPWTPYEARAFNAVLPALREAGEWLPLTARRAVARAVLAELRPELDALTDYENRITWNTTCASCARVLDSSVHETERAEKAEAALERVRAKAAEWATLAPADDWGDTPHDTVLSDAGRYLLKLLDRLAATERPERAGDVASAADIRRAAIAAALTAEHYRRAEARIVASPEEHCAAMADAVMRVVTPGDDGPTTPVVVAHGDPDMSATAREALDALGAVAVCQATDGQAETQALREKLERYGTIAEEQRRRADQAEELLRIAHETSNRSEAERAASVDRAEQAEKRLRLAHEARRGKEHQLDGIRRALCDIGFMDDDDPYSHADLEDVIRQNGQALREAGPAQFLAGPPCIPDHSVPAPCPGCEYEPDTAATEATEPAHNNGPSVAEAAAQDRRWWNGEKDGE